MVKLWMVLLILCGSSSGRVPEVRVDRIELNTVPVGEGSEVVQYIFWQKCDACGTYHVRGWMLRRNGSQERDVRRIGNRYYVRATDRRGNDIDVWSDFFFESKTNTDPERDDQKPMPEGLRLELPCKVKKK